MKNCRIEITIKVTRETGYLDIEALSEATVTTRANEELESLRDVTIARVAECQNLVLGRLDTFVVSERMKLAREAAAKREREEHVS